MIHNLLQGLMLTMAAAGMHMITLDDQRAVMGGWILGFLAQPLFLYWAWTLTPFPWGFFLLAIAYLYSWGRGAVKHARRVRGRG